MDILTVQIFQRWTPINIMSSFTSVLHYNTIRWSYTEVLPLFSDHPLTRPITRILLYPRNINQSSNWRKTEKPSKRWFRLFLLEFFLQHHQSILNSGYQQYASIDLLKKLIVPKKSTREDKIAWTQLKRFLKTSILI